MLSTKLIRSIYNIKPDMREGVITIGNFDGVHKGHQQLLQRITERARLLGVRSTVVTFEPHPFEFFSKQNVTIPRLTRLREKFHALAACGVDFVLVLPFNQQLADLNASDFVTEILYKKLAPTEIILGDDFRFGHNREGDFALLQKMGHEYGFTVRDTQTLALAGERISSTRIRTVLKADDLHMAAELLGRPYALEGRIRTGDKRGRQWGFPTANIFLHRKLTPVRGVYTVLMHGIGEKPLPGVANVGIRPTVDGTRTLLEVHLLDFNQEIYGRYVRVEFCEKLRDESRFANFDLLREAIANDVAAARNYFKKLGML